MSLELRFLLQLNNPHHCLEETVIISFWLVIWLSTLGGFLMVWICLVFMKLLQVPVLPSTSMPASEAFKGMREDEVLQIQCWLFTLY